MQTKELVSVIINCRNSEKFLRDCIDSVINQSYKNLEIILVDNQSRDNTKRIIHSFKDERIKYFKTNNHISLGAARNFALSKSNGEFFAFIDSDDLWNRNKILNVISRFKEGVGLVYSDVLYFNETKSFRLYSHRKIYIGNCFKNLLYDYNLCMSSCVVSKRILNEYKIKFDNNLKVCEDLDFFLKIAYVSKVDYIDEVLTDYRIHDNNLSSRFLDLFYEEYTITVNNLINFFSLEKKQFIKALEFNYINKSKFFWKQKKIKEAFSSLSKIKILILYRLFYSILIIIPYSVVRIFYKPFSKVKIEFNEA